jgi:hypothetical protein
MKSFMRTMGLIVGTAIVLGASAPLASAQPAVASEWSSDWGPVTFELTPGTDADTLHVSGYWQQGTNMRGQIKEGTLDLRTHKMVFTYYQDWNNQHGHVELKLSEDGQTLSGTWAQESGGGGWTMTRKK